MMERKWWRRQLKAQRAGEGRGGERRVVAGGWGRVGVPFGELTGLRSRDMSVVIL